MSQIPVHVEVAVEMRRDGFGYPCPPKSQTSEDEEDDGVDGGSNLGLWDKRGGCFRWSTGLALGL